MTEDAEGFRVRTLLEDRMRDEPPAPAFDKLIDSCRIQHLHRRRRLVTASAVGVALAVAGPVAVTQVLLDGADGPAPANSESEVLARMSDAEIVRTCEKGNQGPKVTSLFFGSGTPAVSARGSVADMSRVVLLSADGRYWATCFINHYSGAEFSAGVEAVHSTEDSVAGAAPYTSGFTCKDLDGPPSPPCDTFMVLYVDRLLDPVAAVTFTTADGVSTTVDADADGFVLFAYAGDVPADYSKTEYRLRDPFLTRITYLSEGGTPLAAQNTGSRTEAMVEGLPLLDAYPSQRTKGIGIDLYGRPPVVSLDALTISLELGEPRADGTMPSRIRVQNLTGSEVVDPGCRRFANFTAGVADLDTPGTFIGRSTSVMTSCMGPETLRAGYDETRPGPVFHVEHLDPGTTYLAVVDYGDARRELLTQRFTVSE